MKKILNYINNQNNKNIMKKKMLNHINNKNVVYT